MAGFFGFFDYNKEGPGVYLNEPPKGPFKTFFAILGRKFWKIVTLNMMYIVFSLPALIIAWIVGTQVLQAVFPNFTPEFLEKLFTAAEGLQNSSQVSRQISQGISDVISQGVSGGAAQPQPLTPSETAGIFYFQASMIFTFTIVAFQLFVLGPVHAGITYIFRNYSREEHAFIWGDFVEHAKKNWKQSLVTGTFGFIAVILLATNYSFYSAENVVKNDFLRGLLTGAIILIAVLFSMMQMYIYPMMVTFKLNIKQLYKNALLFTMARLPFNVGIALVTITLTFVIPGLLLFFAGSIGIIIGIFYYFFLAFGLNLLVTNFFVYRQLKRYMIDPAIKEGEVEVDKGPEVEAIFKDTRPEDIDTDTE